MSNNSGKSDEWTMVIGLIFMFVLLAFIWYTFRHPILEAMRWLRWVELWTLAPLGHDDLAYCRQWAGMIRFDDKHPSVEVMRATLGCFGNSVGTDLDYFGLNAVSMEAVQRKISPFYRWPVTIAIMWVAYYIAFRSPFNKFKTTHTLETFIRDQAKMWPVIRPILDFNPAKSSARAQGHVMPDKIPLFAEAFSPEEWISWHRIPVVNGIPDREATRRAFLLQLGPKWQGFDNLPDYILCLFAAFALMGVQKRDESESFLNDLASSWNYKTGFKPTAEIIKKAKSILADPDVGGQALAVADLHAYRTTALLDVLRWARWMGGVLAPAYFLWLRGVDRPLWYALNNLGRRSFHTEGAGAMAHYMAEQNAKKALPIPRIDTAIVTLNQYMSSPTAQPIPPREGDKKAKRG